MQAFVMKSFGIFKLKNALVKCFLLHRGVQNFAILLVYCTGERINTVWCHKPTLLHNSLISDP